MTRLVNLLRIAAALALLAFPAIASAETDASTNHDFLASAPPPGFDDLARPREVLVDVYVGGSKAGEAIAVARPGFLQFRDPQMVASLVPNLTDRAGLATALSGDLPTHAALACAQSNSADCGRLATELPGIIFDDSRFRVDLFVPSAMLGVIPVTTEKYLPRPSGPVSLTSSLGLSVAGADHGTTTYNFQNRTIVASGSARVVTDISYASRLGFVVDDLVGELDHGDLRYSGGLFWAPGLDLTGRRRILGAGVGTQFDTRADRDNLRATPLVLFLSQPARVEFLIDGRLVGSRSYDAGNNILDTSALPDGSYPLVLRIREADGSTREERRFFVKTPQVVPLGEPLYFAFAGMLAETRPDRAISISDTLYYQFGTARRLSQSLAADLSVVGTQHKTMMEGGLWFLAPIAQLRVAGLASTKGDAAALFQGTSTGESRLNFTFDLRRIWSHDGRPLIPLPAIVDSFDPGEPTAAQIGGSYTQASGTIGYRIGAAYLSVMGSYRKDAHHRSDYSVGPSLTWPIFNRNGLQLTVQADAQRTRTTTAAFAGLQLIYSGTRLSVVGNDGYRSIDDHHDSGGSRSRMVGGLSANYLYEDSSRTQLSTGGGIERGIDSTVAHGGATLYSRYGNVRADLLKSLEDHGDLQYGFTLQSAVAVSSGAIGLGSRDLDDSAVIIQVSGSGSSTFQVFVNDMPYGRVRAGGQLPIHLQPYRTYDVRVRPERAAAVTVDGAPQNVTLYPGSVRVLRWAAHSYFTAFGQAVGSDGRPIGHAMIQAPHSIGETDSNGYFQVDVSDGEAVTLTSGGLRCGFAISGDNPEKDLVSLGKVLCK